MKIRPTESKVFGPKLRSKGWQPWYTMLGQENISGLPSKGSTIRRAHADFDHEDGVCTDIRIYIYRDVLLERDFLGHSVNVTKQVSEFVVGKMDWDELVHALCDTMIAEN